MEEIILITLSIIGMLCFSGCCIYCVIYGSNHHRERYNTQNVQENINEVLAIPKPIIYGIPTIISIDQDYNSSNLPIASQV
jgi:hypothetical protein